MLAFPIVWSLHFQEKIFVVLSGSDLEWMQLEVCRYLCPCLKRSRIRTEISGAPV